MTSSKDSKFRVDMVIGVDQATGKPTFNGCTRQKIHDYRYNNLNFY